MGYLTSKFARFLQKSHLSFKNIEGNSFENSQGNSKRCSGSGDKSLIRFGHEIEIWNVSLRSRVRVRSFLQIADC